MHSLAYAHASHIGDSPTRRRLGGFVGFHPVCSESLFQHRHTLLLNRVYSGGGDFALDRGIGTVIGRVAQQSASVHLGCDVAHYHSAGGRGRDGGGRFADHDHTSVARLVCRKDAAEREIAPPMVFITGLEIGLSGAFLFGHVGRAGLAGYGDLAVVQEGVCGAALLRNHAPQHLQKNMSIVAAANAVAHIGGCKNAVARSGAVSANNARTHKAAGVGYSVVHGADVNRRHYGSVAVGLLHQGDQTSCLGI
ncbi:unknown [Prevotella sp. CAG:873]|nr:unknown [Prevotella sp. CAG:873]